MRSSRHGHVGDVTQVRRTSLSTFLEVDFRHAAVRWTTLTSTASPHVIHVTSACNSVPIEVDLSQGRIQDSLTGDVYAHGSDLQTVAAPGRQDIQIIDGSECQPTDDKPSMKGAWLFHVNHLNFSGHQLCLERLS